MELFLVIAIVVAAVSFVAWRLYKAVTAPNQSCGCGECGKPKKKKH